MTKRAAGPRTTALQRCPAPFRDAAVDNWPPPFVGMCTVSDPRLADIVRLHIRRADGLHPLGMH